MKQELFVFPDYRRANPYQKLMYDHVDKYFSVQFGQIERASVTLTNAGLGRHVIFHLHWEDAVYRHAPDEQTAWRQTQSFLDQLEHFTGAGGHILWTIHNRSPHEDPYPEIHPVLCKKLVALVDTVHVHGPSAARWLVDQWDIAPDKIAMIPHGNYSPIYKTPDRTKEDLRAEHDIQEQDRVFLLFGRLGSYKGAKILIQAFSKLTDPECRLVIAGTPITALEETISTLPDAARQRLLYLPGFVDEHRLPELFHMADFVVMPYQSVLTSGTLLLALSLGKPVIVPDIAELLELASADINGLVYQQSDPDALAETLQQAAALPDDIVAAMSKAALATAKGYDWRFLGGSLSGLLHRMIALKPVSRRLPLLPLQ